ncbi:MAG: apolipoprotein N-acyltransferase [Spirochaeta sp.]
MNLSIDTTSPHPVRLQTTALTVLSAILLPLSLPNPIFSLGSPLLGVFALVPLYMALMACQSVRQSIRMGIIFGIISTSIGNFWLAFFQDFSIWTLGGAVIGYAVYNALLFPFLFQATRSKLPIRPIWFAAIWTGYELLKSIGFLGYPWGLLAYSWNEVLPLIQIADLFGVYGISFLLVLANATTAEFLRGVQSAELRQVTAFTAVLAAAAWIYGLTALERDIPRIDTIDAVLIQNDGDSWQPGGFWPELERIQTLTNQAIESNPEPDLIVWSETVLRYPLQEYRSYYRSNPLSSPFLSFLDKLPAPLLSGGAYIIDRERNDLINAALLLDRQGVIQEVYGKQHLVPFAETIPFFEYDAVRWFFQSVIGLRSMWLSGMEYRMFPLQGSSGNTLQYGTPICFEDAFSYITRDMAHEGADFFINITNNSWSRTDSAQTQHFAAARFRTIETRRTLIRATNSGFTSVVDPWGRSVASLPMFTPAVLHASVDIYRPAVESVYMLVGDLLAWLCILATATALVTQNVVQYKRKAP